MKAAEVISLGTTLICLMAIPSYIGIKANKPLIGILVAGISTITYLIRFAIKRK